MQFAPFKCAGCGKEIVELKLISGKWYVQICDDCWDKFTARVTESIDQEITKGEKNVKN